MAVRGTITYQGLNALFKEGDGVTRKGFAEVTKQSLYEAANYWREKFLPKHFEESAYARYGIPARTKKYIRRKRRRFGHNQPLVWLGRSKAMILNDRGEPLTRRKAGVLGVELRIAAPKHFFQYRKTGKIVNKAEEVTRITQGEVEVLAQKLDKFLRIRYSEIAANRPRKSTIVSGAA